MVPFRSSDTPRHAIMSLLDHPHIKHVNAQTVLRYADQRDTTADAEIRGWRRRKITGCSNS